MALQFSIRIIAMDIYKMLNKEKKCLVPKLSSIRLGSQSINYVYLEGCNPFKPCTADVSAQMMVRVKRCS